MGSNHQYLICITSFTGVLIVEGYGEKWLHVDGVICQSYINLGVCKLFEALEMNPRILNGG